MTSRDFPSPGDAFGLGGDDGLREVAVASLAPDAAAPLCSVLSASLGLPLIGSAGCYDRILAFELGAPWTPRLVGSRGSDAAIDAAIVRIGAEADGLRLLALEPRTGESASTLVRVLLMERGEGAFRRYSCREFDVPCEALAEALEGIAFGSEQAPVGPTSQGRDILVCTHGARDACCGKFGYPIYREFVALAEKAGEDAPRIWRCSHLGGHRFAPTILDLPSGRMYGRMTTDDASAVLGGGDALLARVPAIYRGRVVLPEVAQVVERELWIQQGAAFESAALRWKVDAGAGAWAVTVETDAPPAVMRARVILADASAIAAPASCGRDPEPEAPWQIIAEE